MARDPLKKAADELRKLIAKHAVVIIAGVSNTGKKSLSERGWGRPVVHTDDWLDKPYNEVPELAAAAAQKALDEEGKVLIEGVRALSVTRHGIEPGGVLWLRKPLKPLTRDQLVQARGRITNFGKWYGSYRGTDVEVVMVPQQK